LVRQELNLRFQHHMHWPGSDQITRWTVYPDPIQSLRSWIAPHAILGRIVNSRFPPHGWGIEPQGPIWLSG
jgi:hypothetical protein